MARSHLCKNREWVDGPVAGCDDDSHGRPLPTTQGRVKGIIGPKEARAIDANAGNLGVDRGTHIRATS